jgi:hypothetical protein
MSRLGMINLLNVGLQIINPYHGWHDVAILIMGGLIKVQGARFQVQGNPGVQISVQRVCGYNKRTRGFIAVGGGLCTDEAYRRRGKPPWLPWFNVAGTPTMEWAGTGACPYGKYKEFVAA